MYYLNLLCALVFICIYLLKNRNTQIIISTPINSNLALFIKNAFHSLFNNDADCYWYTQKVYETSTIYITTRNELAGKLTVVYKKSIRPYNYMSTAVETSFFCLHNVGFLNSKLGWEADANRTIN